MNTEDRVKKVVAHHHCIAPEIIRSDSLLISPAEGFDGDSLDNVEIMMALEDEFHIEIPDWGAEKLKTVQQAVDYVDSLKLPA